MKNLSTPQKIPDQVGWKGYADNFDCRYPYKLFFGKSHSEMYDFFKGGRAIERAHELLYLPRPVFQYYVFSLAQFLSSDESKNESDAASAFLSLLKNREQRDVGSVKKIYEKLRPFVETVSNRQDFYDADRNIYGDFKHTKCEIDGLLDAV